MTQPPKTTAEILLAEIETFIRTHRMAATTFGKQACGDAHLVGYLRAGRSITTRRLDQCRAFMRDYKPLARNVGKRNKEPEIAEGAGR